MERRTERYADVVQGFSEPSCFVVAGQSLLMYHPPVDCADDIGNTVAAHKIACHTMVLVYLQSEMLAAVCQLLVSPETSGVKSSCQGGTWPSLLRPQPEGSKTKIHLMAAVILPVYHFQMIWDCTLPKGAVRLRLARIISQQALERGSLHKRN